MSDAARRHGLESFLATASADAEPGVSLSVRGDAGVINLRGSPGNAEFLDAAAAVLGQPLPVEANTFTAGSMRVYWLGPDEWLVVTAAERVAALVGALETACAGHPVAINDLSGGYVVLGLGGPRARDVLARGCTIDLHPAVFRAGRAAQTGLGKAGVLIGLVDDAPQFEIVVRRSFADHLGRWIVHVARRFGIDFAS